MIKKLSKITKSFLVVVLIFGWIFSGWPQIWHNPSFPPKIQEVYAATNTETITASQTWTAPAGVTSVSAECWGSGGQGGGSTSATLGGTGGGAGAYAKTASVAVTPGTGYTLTVGALVTNGAGLAGGTGGDTSFTGDSSQKCLAKGGGGGAINGGTAGAGGLASASTGDAGSKWDGGGGFKTVTTAGGGGGSSGGTASAGNTATTQTGATAVAGGGNGGNGGNAMVNGSAPTTAPSGGGGGGGCSFKAGVCSAAGGNTKTTGGAGKIGQVKLTYTIYTVLGNGTDGGNLSRGPGGAAAEIDRFSFIGSTGTTDTVTGLTITLAGDVNAYTNVATVDVQTTGSVSKCSSSSITSNTVTLSSCAIAITTTLTEYKIIITPKAHADMTAPPGASYATTATVTDWAGTNTHAGTDSGSATVTIDNASPNGATSASGSGGTGAATLNWTTSNSSDFSTTNGSVVLRWAAASAGNAVPLEGKTDYVAGNTIVGGDSQTATVACVISSAASTAISNKIDGTGGSSGCNTSALADNTQYSYKVFQVDTNGNYDIGAAIGTFLTKPGAPTSLGFTNVTATTLRVGWTAPTGGAASYKVERCTGTGCSGWAELTTGVTNVYYDDIGRTGNTIYRYQVRATNTTGDSGYSSGSEQLMLPDVPGTPSFSGVTDTSITVTWNASTGGSNNNYYVERAPDVSGSPGTWTEVGTNVTSPWTNNTGLSCGTTYWYKVRGNNATGYSSYSGNNSQITGACNTAPSFSGNPTDSPDPIVAGYNVTFSGTANDSESNSWYLAVCKTNSITAGAPPTCDSGQTYCVSTSAVSSGSSNNCTWTSSGSTAQNWYAFACDNDASPICSSENHANSPITVNAVVVSVSVSPTTTNYGTMAINEVKKADTANANDEFIVTNAGNVAEDFDIISGNAIGGAGWTLSTTAVGSSIFMHAYSTLKTLAASFTLGSVGDQATNWVAMDNDPNYRALVNNVAVSGTVDLVLELLSPSAMGNYGVSKEIVVTIRATQH